MERAKIKDLTKEMEISTEELRMIGGGINPEPEPPKAWYLRIDRWHTVGELGFLERFPNVP